ncbi:MAG: pseudouridine synthase [Cyanobacteria bacterium P01_D01_bin.50]
MLPLHPISDFIDTACNISNSSPTYYYQGYADGELLQLPRTREAEAIAQGLMQQLATDEVYSRQGKMYGILLVELQSGEKGILKAFSGLLNGCSVVEGWVPPIPGREKVVLEETRTLGELEDIKQEIILLKQLIERKEYKTIALQFQQRLQEMDKRHQVNKQQRQEKRQLLEKNLEGEELTIALEKLNEASRRDGIERKLLKKERDGVLQPLQEVVKNADMRIGELKQRRKEISRKLQEQMHAAYSVMNFLGNSSSLQQLMPQGLPTGTGDCCAPKLLHFAAINGLKPLAIAEFWWGESKGDKIQGEFYGACVERCQPLMGFLLSGLSELGVDNQFADTLKGAATFTKPVFTGFSLEVGIIYEDEWLIAVNKPAGLLSVPGRYYHNQDSVLSRLINLFSDGENIRAVHRLDMDTSGVLLLAKDREIYSLLSKQFEERLVSKVYEAVLSGDLDFESGMIDLPLWGNPENRPYQEVNYQKGKVCFTKFRVLEKEGNYTRVEFIPLTGRTHQLRVHTAEGLGVPILGDKLYGCEMEGKRLHLHARELSFVHPFLGERVFLEVELPF